MTWVRSGMSSTRGDRASEGGACLAVQNNPDHSPRLVAIGHGTQQPLPMREYPRVLPLVELTREHLLNGCTVVRDRIDKLSTRKRPFDVHQFGGAMDRARALRDESDGATSFGRVGAYLPVFGSVEYQIQPGLIHDQPARDRPHTRR